MGMTVSQILEIIVILAHVFEKLVLLKSSKKITEKYNINVFNKTVKQLSCKTCPQLLLQKKRKIRLIKELIKILIKK